MQNLHNIQSKLPSSVRSPGSIALQGKLQVTQHEVVLQVVTCEYPPALVIAFEGFVHKFDPTRIDFIKLGKEISRRFCLSGLTYDVAVASPFTAKFSSPRHKFKAAVKVAVDAVKTTARIRTLRAEAMAAEYKNLFL